MRFIKKWSYGGANYLASVRQENHQRRLIYYYSLQVIIGAIVKVIITLLTAYIFGIFTPMLVTVLSFSIMRKLAGGYHMDTYSKCLFVSLALFILASLIAKYTYMYWNSLCLLILIILTFVIGLYVLIKYAPKDNPNKRITDPREIRKLKTLSLIYLFIWVFTTIFVFFKNKVFVLPLCFGILLSLFIITPTGHRFFDYVKSSLNNKKKHLKQKFSTNHKYFLFI